MLHPYIFSLAVVILLVCIYALYRSQRDSSSSDKMNDLIIAILAWAILSSYCSMSFLYLSAR